MISCLLDSDSVQQMKSLSTIISSISCKVMIKSLFTSSLNLIFASLNLGTYQVIKITSFFLFSYAFNECYSLLQWLLITLFLFSVMLAFSVIKSYDPEWFFFSPRVYKYSSSTRCDRKTKRGFWKATGKDRNIKIRGTNNVIGTKKTLVFHQRSVPSAPGVKTDWVIHEYHAVTFDVTQVCISFFAPLFLLCSKKF